MNHYETLALKTSASHQDIMNAYRKLSEKFDPAKTKDDLFIPIFKEIKEAYDTLSNEQTRKEYDKRLNLNQPSITSEVTDTSSPKIISFQSDRNDFEEGEKITLKWDTRFADKVILKPFGTVPLQGTKTFKLKNFSKDELAFTLQVTNSTSNITTHEVLKLKNKVSEIDFSEFEEEENPVELGFKVSNPEVGTKEESLHHEKTGKEANSEVTNPEIANSEKSINSQEEIVRANSFTGTASPILSAEYNESFFSTKGRLRRSTHFLRSLIIGITAFAISSLIAETPYYDDGTIVFLSLGYLFLVITGWIQTIKRCHDMNHSGWLALLYLVPLVNIGLGLYLLFGEGTRGENKYGPDPKGR